VNASGAVVYFVLHRQATALRRDGAPARVADAVA